MAIQTEYDVKHTCGHTQHHDLSDKPAGDRVGFVKWLESKECIDCFKNDPKRKEELRKKLQAEDMERAEANATKLELPRLEGSEKQVTWAMTCRDNLIMDAHEVLVNGDDPAMTDEEFEDRILDPARRIVRAGWWIDVRDQEVTDLEELVTTVSDENVTDNPFE